MEGQWNYCKTYRRFSVLYSMGNQCKVYRRYSAYNKLFLYEKAIESGIFLKTYRRYSVCNRPFFFEKPIEGLFSMEGQWKVFNLFENLSKEDKPPKISFFYRRLHRRSI